MDQFAQHSPAPIGADPCLRCDQQLVPFYGTAHPVTAYKTDLARFIAENMKRWDRQAQRLYIASQKEIVKLETKHMHEAWRTNRHDLITAYNNNSGQSRDRDQPKHNPNGVVPFLQAEAVLRDKQQQLDDQRRHLDDLCFLLRINYTNPLMPNMDSPEFVFNTPPANPFGDGDRSDLLLGSPEISYKLQAPPLHSADSLRPAAPSSPRSTFHSQPLIQFDEPNDGGISSASQQNGVTSSGNPQLPLTMAHHNTRSKVSVCDPMNLAHRTVHPGAQSFTHRGQKSIQNLERHVRRAKHSSIPREWESSIAERDSIASTGRLESLASAVDSGCLISLATDVDDANTDGPQESSYAWPPPSSVWHDLAEVDRLQRLADSHATGASHHKTSDSVAGLSSFPLSHTDIAVPHAAEHMQATNQAPKVGKYPRRPLPHVPNEDLVDRIFKTEEDRMAAMRNNRESYGGVSPIFRYGVQYSPNIPASEIRPEHQDVDYQCRTVVISGLPVGVEVRDVSARVRGGLVIRITMVDTRTVNNGITALVCFADWHSAHAYASYVAKSPISICGSQVKVALAHKPSYPLPRMTALSLEQNATRCLAIENYPSDRCDQLFQHISGCFRNPEDVLEDIFIGDNATIFISFRTIEFASRFHGIIQRCEEYANVKDGLRFSQDPCEASLDTLQLPARLARGGFPSLLDAWVQNKQRHDHVGGGHPQSQQQPNAPRETFESTKVETTNAVQRNEVELHSLALGVANPDASVLEQDVKSPGSPHPTECDSANTKERCTKPGPAQPAIDIEIFKPQGEEWIGYKAYTLQEYNEKYGYKEYVKDPEQWKKDYPYVGQLRRLAPVEERPPPFTG